MEVVKRPKHMELIDCCCVMTPIAAPWDSIVERMRQMENILVRFLFDNNALGPLPELALSKLQAMEARTKNHLKNYFLLPKKEGLNPSSLNFFQYFLPKSLLAVPAVHVFVSSSTLHERE